MMLKHAHGFLFAILLCFAGAATLQAQPPFDMLPDRVQPPTEDTADDDAEASDDDAAERIRPGGGRSSGLGGGQDTGGARPIRPFSRPDDADENPDQPVKLNVKYAGWEGAGIGGEGASLSDEIRGNWIMVDSNGRFEGRVVPMDNAQVGRMVVFLMNKGRLVKQTSVDADGMYEFKSVRQGAYALVGWSEGAFFAFGLNILANTEDANPQIPNRVTTLAFQNRTTINTDWIRHFAAQVNYRVYGRYPEGEGPTDDDALYGFIGLVENQPDAVPATSISGHNVVKTADGRLIGRVHQLSSESGRPVDVRSTKVMLLQNDGVYASTTVGSAGVFEFSDIAPGRYAVAAAGVDGGGLIGINVVENDRPLMNENGELSDSEEADAGSLFDFCLMPSETMGWLNHYATEIAYRRVVLSPRPPMKPAGGCNACNGAGCQHCNGGYRGRCTSRCITFNQWASECSGAYCRDKASKPDGFLRRVIDNADDTFEKAFYSGNGDGISGGLRGGVGTEYMPNSGAGNNGYGTDASGYRGAAQPSTGAGYK